MSIKAFIPSKYYVALSITGLWCELKCPYCKGRYLKGMLAVTSPKELHDTIIKLWNRGTRGVLISGGFTKNGYLPLGNEYLEIIKKIKKETGMVVSVHSGLIGKELIDRLWASHVDFIDFEVPPSNNYLKYMKNLPHHNLEMYLDILSYTLNIYDKDFIVPHIVLVSKSSTLEEERSTVRRVIEFEPVRLVFLVEIPTKLYEEVDLERVIKIMKYTREISSIETILGCMRPWWIKKKLDALAIEKHLINRIATPTNQTIKKYNLEVIYACCSTPNKYLNQFPKGGLLQ